jgi:hypothetical protein
MPDARLFRDRDRQREREGERKRENFIRKHIRSLT